MLLNALKSSLLVVDVQEKLFDKIEDNFLISKAIINSIKVFSILKLPIIYSEQYPKGLGLTIKSILNEIENSSSLQRIEKTTFSCFPGHENFFKTKEVVIVGIESHICVLQTAFDLKLAGHDVFIIDEAVGSRHHRDKVMALERARENNIAILNFEMFVFELLKDSKHKHFKEISTLIK